jgi:hypothetical protein
LNQCWAVLDSYEETLVLVPVLISKNRIGCGSDFGTGTRFSVFSKNRNQTGIRILVFKELELDPSSSKPCPPHKPPPLLQF